MVFARRNCFFAEMENLNLIEMPALVDLLARETALYARLFADRTDHDAFVKCRQRIEAIQEEIHARRKLRSPGQTGPKQ